MLDLSHKYIDWAWPLSFAAAAVPLLGSMVLFWRTANARDVLGSQTAKSIVLWVLMIFTVWYAAGAVSSYVNAKNQ
jgi:hypothetical protein